MKEREEEFGDIVTQWEDTILYPFHKELSKRLTKLEHSALYSSLPHCFRGFHEIYYKILPALLQTSRKDYDKLHELIYDIGGISGLLQEIKTHIIDAESGFNQLIKLLAEKAESQGNEL